jgi:hypothetical protein
MKITYAIGAPQAVFRNLKRHNTYLEAAYWRQRASYDVLYVYRGEELLLCLDLEGLSRRVCLKRRYKPFEFHPFVERALKRCLRKYR